MLHDARRCELSRSCPLSKRGILMVRTNAGSFVCTTKQSVIHGITAGRKTFSSAIYEGFLLIAR